MTREGGSVGEGVGVGYVDITRVIFSYIGLLSRLSWRIITLICSCNIFRKLYRKSEKNKDI